MARSSCIRHPASEPLIVIRKWQVAVCGDNTCAAALLSFFEYWHCLKIDMREKARHSNAIAERHGDAGVQDETLLQFHSAEALVRGLLGLYKEDTIRVAIKYLVGRGFIEQRRNPNPRYKFDKTRHFLFCVDRIHDALDDYLLPMKRNSPLEEGEMENRFQINRISSLKNPPRYLEHPLPSSECRPRSPENRSAIPEITTETAEEISIEDDSASASAITVFIEGWSRPEQIFRDLEFLHGVDPMFVEFQFVEFRSWWREKGQFTQGEWDSKFLQRCADKWDSRLVRQQALQKGR